MAPQVKGTCSTICAGRREETRRFRFRVDVRFCIAMRWSSRQQQQGIVVASCFIKYTWPRNTEELEWGGNETEWNDFK